MNLSAFATDASYPPLHGGGPRRPLASPRRSAPARSSGRTLPPVSCPLRVLLIFLLFFADRASPGNLEIDLSGSFDSVREIGRGWLVCPIDHFRKWRSIAGRLGRRLKTQTDAARPKSPNQSSVLLSMVWCFRYRWGSGSSNALHYRGKKHKLTVIFCSP